MLRGAASHVGATDIQQVLLEGMLLCHASLLLLAWGRVRVWTLLGPGQGLLIDRFDGCGPGEELLIVRILLFEVMPIAQAMHPAALMQALMTSVAGREVAAEHAAVVLADQLFDHFPFSRMMVLKIADVRRGGTPDVAIAAIFSPPRLIGLPRWARDGLRFAPSQAGPRLAFEPVHLLHNLATV